MTIRRHTDVLYRVSAPHFVAGFTVNVDGYVTSTAPILNWMQRRELDDLRRYCLIKRWQLERVAT